MYKAVCLHRSYRDLSLAECQAAETVPNTIVSKKTLVLRWWESETCKFIKFLKVELPP